MSGGSFWVPDVPDFRDQTVFQASFRERLTIKPAERIDLSEYFLEPELASPELPSAAVSVGGLVEFFNGYFNGDSRYVSKRFIADVGKRLQQVQSPEGISIRTALKAVSRFGAPPNEYYSQLAGIMDPFLYSFGDQYSNTRFVRIDAGDKKPRKILNCLKKLLTLHHPCVFGFPVMSSVSKDSRIEFRPAYDKVRGSSTGIIVGYDDAFRMTRQGAFLFRSSWGKKWGNGGFGWIDFRYVEQKMMRDIWTFSKSEWTE